MTYSIQEELRMIDEGTSPQQVKQRAERAALLIDMMEDTAAKKDRQIDYLMGWGNSLSADLQKLREEEEE